MSVLLVAGFRGANELVSLQACVHIFDGSASMTASASCLASAILPVGTGVLRHRM